MTSNLEREDFERKVRDGLITQKFYVCMRCDHIEASYTFTDRCLECGWEGELDVATSLDNAQRIVSVHRTPGYNRAIGRINAPEAKETAQAGIVAKKVANTIAEGVPPIKWRIENLLTTNGIVIIASPPKQFKTFVAIQAAISISNGTSFLDKFPTTKGVVLYIDEENGEANLIRRFKQLADGEETTVPDTVFYTSFESIKLDTTKGALMVEELILAYRPDVVFLDSMVRFMEGDEDRSSDVRIVFENLKKLLARFSVSFFILHHTRKGNGTKTKSLDDLRGSSDFGAFADAIIGVEAHDRGFLFRVIANRHVGLMEILPQEIEVVSDRKDGPIKLQNHGVQQNRKVKAKVALMAWAHKNNIKKFSSRQARDELVTLGLDRKAYYEAINELLRDGEVVEQRRGEYHIQLGSFSVDDDVSPGGGRD